MKGSSFPNLNIMFQTGLRGCRNNNDTIPTNLLKMFSNKTAVGYRWPVIRDHWRRYLLRHFLEISRIQRTIFEPLN